MEAKVSDGEAVLGTDAPRRIVLHFLHDLDRETRVEAFKESLAANSSNAASMTGDVGKMLGAFAPMTAGDEWNGLLGKGQGWRS